MSVPSIPVLDREQGPGELRPAASGMLIGGLVLVPVVLLIIGRLLGGAAGSELVQIAVASIQALPFMVLAVLSYLGLRYAWGKAASLVWLALLVGAGALGVVLLGVATLVTIGDPAGETPFMVAPNAAPMITLLVLGALASVIIAALGFIPAVRRTVSRFIPLDPNSFVHMVMLVTVVALTLLCFLPLPILGEPSLLTLINTASQSGTDLTNGRGDAGQLRDTLYGLVWLVPATVVAVGFGIKRDLRAALLRLGLVRPTLRQVLVGLGTAVLMVVAVALLSSGVDWLWGVMGWPTTDGEAVGELFDFAISPIGAVVIGITAGLGEELAVRGVLQPRAGILLSNLFFTSLHALQYNWDSLLIVFLVGLVLGLLRKRTNTTTSAIAHGTYDFLLILASALAIPWLGE